MSRWQLQRAGIFNFWYYSEEEFLFEDGRLILRGTNGSGKSVTMQSLIPLVLDGDKRPERLDPFGSRDRKLEYYLLGEAGEGHTDRTGYLWLEFYHTHKKIYKTIGIGLRARRGVTQLSFWGFLLEDGRRINHNFYLYDHSLWLEQNRKVPLSRKLLEESIASGGQVVQEQKVYRDLVNKALFGFRDQSSYGDLLKLLLELRSPKLSKDFKPSSMYDILTRALPPLMDDELSSLSDLLENMDEITDRLEELQRHIEDLKVLDHHYNNYNSYMLYRSSVDVLEHSQRYDDSLNREQQISDKVKEIKEKLQKVAQDLADNYKRIEVIGAELEILNRSEAIEKQKELESAQEQLTTIKNQYAAITTRLAMNSNRLAGKQQEFAELKERLKRISEEQEQSMNELEDIARDIEFYEHDIYHGLWNRTVLEDDKWAEKWLRDVDEHKKKLQDAEKTARVERETSRTVSEAEIMLGEITNQRNIIEVEQSEQEKVIEDVKAKLKEEIVIWQQSLCYLSITDDMLRDMLRLLTDLTIRERQLESAHKLIGQVHEQQRHSLSEQIMQKEQHRELLLNDRQLIEQQLDQWLSEKEVEPTTSEKRKFSRSQRSKGTGAPLYTACEFDGNLTEEQKAGLEETLFQMGLLDAWIFPGGQIEGLTQVNEEEIWVEPAINDTKKTLAAVLCPTPPADSGLTVEDIRLALSSFSWTTEEDSLIQPIKQYSAFVSSKGLFKLGPLVGCNQSKEQAEFIGREARLRTKQLVIAQLESDIAEISLKIEAVNKELKLLEMHKKMIGQELALFPSDQELQQQVDKLINISTRLNEIMNQEQKIVVWYKEKVAEWRTVQLELAEQTANWSRLKNETQISEAVQLSTAYREQLSELRSLWLRHLESAKHLKHQEEELGYLFTVIEDDQNEEREVDLRKEKLTVKIGQLQKLIKEMGLENIHLQIVHLKQEDNNLKKTIKELNNSREHLSKEEGKAIANLEAIQNQVHESRVKLDNKIEVWQNEFKLSLVQQWSDQKQKVEDFSTILSICTTIVRGLKGQFSKIVEEKILTDLQLEFQKARTNLPEYALDISYINTGRMLITSSRDRLNPLSPVQLLEELIELENEQKILLTSRDRGLYEEIVFGSVGNAIRNRIHRARDWVEQMDNLMKERNTSSGLKLSLKWIPLTRKSENDMDIDALVELLMYDADRMGDQEFEMIISHFRTRVFQAKEEATDEYGALRKYIYQLLDYRSWFEFKLYFNKGERSNYTELTDSKFNVLSGGEKAMSMYIPLFAATYSRYSDANEEAPKIISLDEAFAGVDDANIRDMFHLLTDMQFDYMMTSQVLWGCYDTVPSLAIYEIYRPKDANVLALFHYRWNGERRILVE